MYDGCRCPICSEGKLKKEVVSKQFEYKGHYLIIPDYIQYICNECKKVFSAEESVTVSKRLLREWKNEIEKKKWKSENLSIIEEESKRTN